MNIETKFDTNVAHIWQSGYLSFSPETLQNLGNPDKVSLSYDHTNRMIMVDPKCTEGRGYKVRDHNGNGNYMSVFARTFLLNNQLNCDNKAYEVVVQNNVLFVLL